MTRKLARSISSHQVLVKLKDGEFCLSTSVSFLTHQQKFIPGQEIKTRTIDGRKVTNVFTIDGNKLIERQIEPNREVIIIREFYANEMKGILKVGEVTSHTGNEIYE